MPPHNSNNEVSIPLQIACKHMPLAGQIARRLYRRYSWVSLDDMHSYAFLGMAKAAKIYDPNRGVPFPQFACTKAMFLAIDEMRKDGVLRRADSTNRVQDSARLDFDLPDPSADRAKELLEAREFCGELLRRLGQKDRKLLTMVYSDKMTYREIARVYDISESAVCLRHKSLIGKLRKQAAVRQMAA